MDTNINNIITLPNSQQYDDLLLAAKAIANGLEDVAENKVRSYYIGEWRTVQSIVRLGLAKNFFQVGDQLQCSHDTYGTLTWDIIGIDYDIPVNPETGEELKTIDASGNEINRHSLTLQLHGCFGKISYNATKGTSWENCHLRAWLNSSEIITGYALNGPGFLNGLDEDLSNIISPISKAFSYHDGRTFHTKKIVDKIFVPSITEVYGGEDPNTYCNDGAILSTTDTIAGQGKSYCLVDSNGLITKLYLSDGDPIPANAYELKAAYEFYGQGRSSLSLAGLGNDSNRIKNTYPNLTSAGTWWLRSPAYENNGASNVHQRGNIGTQQYVIESYYVSPCVVIA